MVNEAELVEAVDAAFGVTGRGFEGWVGPSWEGEPAEEDYSRVRDPGKWLILGARVEAWVVAAAELGLATVERSVEVQWAEAPGTVISWTDRLVPQADGALPIVIGHSRVGDGEGVGLTLGVGDPAVCFGVIPFCGCDACNMGSQEELDQLDEHMLGVITGEFRHLTRGKKQITIVRTGWSQSSDVEDLDTTEWTELSGPAWL